VRHAYLSAYRIAHVRRSLHTRLDAFNNILMLLMRMPPYRPVRMTRHGCDIWGVKKNEKEPCEVVINITILLVRLLFMPLLVRRKADITPLCAPSLCTYAQRSRIDAPSPYLHPAIPPLRTTCQHVLPTPPVAIPSLQLHHTPPIPHSTRAQRRIRHPNIFRCGICKRVAVARKIVRHTVRDNS
jgi:hypothetical protein